jgi:hypothetical protein
MLRMHRTTVRQRRTMRGTRRTTASRHRTAAPAPLIDSLRILSTPGGIRTPDLWLRRPPLYPAELRAQESPASITRRPHRPEQGIRAHRKRGTGTGTLTCVRDSGTRQQIRPKTMAVTRTRFATRETARRPALFPPATGVSRASRARGPRVRPKRRVRGGSPARRGPYATGIARPLTRRAVSMTRTASARCARITSVMRARSPTLACTKTASSATASR